MAVIHFPLASRANREDMSAKPPEDPFSNLESNPGKAVCAHNRSRDLSTNGGSSSST